MSSESKYQFEWHILSFMIQQGGGMFFSPFGLRPDVKFMWSKIQTFQIQIANPTFEHII